MFPPYLHPFASAPPISVLRSLIVGEAEGELYQGKLAVACVVRNRVAQPGWWGGDYVSVCLAKHQFSCFWSDWLKREAVCMAALADKTKYADAHKAASNIVLGNVPDVTKGATHYFNPKVVLPSWAKSMKLVAVIGSHAFYK